MTTVLHDDFNAADALLDGRFPVENNLPSGTPAWVKKGGTTENAFIASNVLRTAVDFTNAIYTLDCEESDGRIYADVQTSSDTGAWVGIVFRLNDHNDFHQVRVRYNGTTNILMVQQIEAGAYSALISGLDIGGDNLTPFTLRVDMEGTTISVYVNDVQVWNGVITHGVSDTNHGIYLYNQGVQLDNWYFTDLGGFGPPPPPATIRWVGNPVAALRKTAEGSPTEFQLGFNLNEPAWFQSVNPFKNIAKHAAFYVANTGGGVLGANGFPASGPSKLDIKVWGGQKVASGTYDITHSGTGTGPTSIVITDQETISLTFDGQIGSDFAIRLQGDSGEYTSTFATRANPAKCIRFMDAMRTNFAEFDPANQWVRTVLGASNTFAHRIMAPADIAAMCLAHDCDAWVCIHHLATNDNISDFAADLAALMSGTGRLVYVEHSNEVWNGAFPQTRWVDANFPNRSGYHADRSDEIAQLFKAEFFPHEVVGVLASQLDGTGLINGMVQNAARSLSYIDAVSAAPYFGGPPSLGLGPYAKTISQIEAMTSGQIVNYAIQDLNGRVKEKALTWKANAAARGWRFIGYEGGSHLRVRFPTTDVAAQNKLDIASQSTEMGVAYSQFLDWWETDIADLLCIYMDVSTGDGKPWGHREYELEADSPRWAQVMTRMSL